MLIFRSLVILFIFYSLVVSSFLMACWKLKAETTAMDFIKIMYGSVGSNNTDSVSVLGTLIVVSINSLILLLLQYRLVQKLPAYDDLFTADTKMYLKDSVAKSKLISYMTAVLIW